MLNLSVLSEFVGELSPLNIFPKSTAFLIEIRSNRRLSPISSYFIWNVSGGLTASSMVVHVTWSRVKKARSANQRGLKSLAKSMPIPGCRKKLF